ncbi:hypothetical protein [Methylococcus mesophilus]|uniref:hypothetical protein n=1 Tax=Methylococcus mesophilus TaxID=2993564 RepID=UPI00224A635E|nr:hypothetical protein [Methylococcus mesophilus]UZR30724.1 hypothetical protein OOT43_08890 [Methylococcus mesophilus]
MFATARKFCSESSAKVVNAARSHKAEVVTATGTGLAAANDLVFAAGPDFTTLTTGIDFGTAATAIMAVGVAVAAALIALRGTRMVLSAIGGR